MRLAHRLLVALATWLTVAPIATRLPAPALHVVAEQPQRRRSGDALLGGIFVWANQAPPGAAAIPNAANALAVFVRTGPFWQDTARTTPATVVGQNVKCWDDVSGNGKHAVWSSGGIPTLATGGGIDCPSGGAQLDSPALSADNTWSWYITCTDANTGDNGIALSDTSGLTNTCVQPRVAGLTYFICGGTYDTLADVVGETTRGMSCNGTAVTGFVGATEGSWTLTSSTVGGLTIGSINVTFPWQGQVRNVAFYSTTDDATARGNARTYLATA